MRPGIDQAPRAAIQTFPVNSLTDARGAADSPAATVAARRQTDNQRDSMT